MAIDLSKVSISLDQFQKMASGSYNAGEVALKSATSLTKINNHVHFTSLNTKTISHEEIMAIKNAFVNALQSNGVTGDAINKVRKQLGLEPDEAAPKALASRSIKPLTRQQIREIIDDNIGTINTSRLSNKQTELRDSNSLYGTKQSTLNKMEAGRTAAQEGLNRTLTPSQEIANFQSLFSGESVHPKDCQAMAKLAQQKKDEILAQGKDEKGIMEYVLLKPDGNLAQGKDTKSVVLTFTTTTGQTIQFASGKNRTETLKMLDEACLRFTQTYNNAVIDALSYSGGKDAKIPCDDFLAMAKDVRQEATNIFGKEHVNQNDEEIGNLVRANDYLTLKQSMMKDGKGTFITPESMRAHFREACLKNSANSFVSGVIKNVIGSDEALKSFSTLHGKGATELDVGRALRAIHPNLLTELAAAKDLAEVKTKFEPYKKEIVLIAKKSILCNKYNHMLADFVQKEYAKQTNATWKEGDKNLVNLSERVYYGGQKLTWDLLANENRLDNERQIGDDFKRLAEGLVFGRAEQMRRINELNLPEGPASLVKQHVAYNGDADSLSISSAHKLSMDVDVKGLADAFKTNEKKEVYAALEKIMTNVGDKVKDLFPNKKLVGAEELALGRPVVIFMALGREEGLYEQFTNFFARPDVQNDTVSLPIAVLREHVKSLEV